MTQPPYQPPPPAGFPGYPSHDPRFPAAPAYAPPPARFGRPFGIVVLGILNAIGALFYTGGGVLMAAVGVSMEHAEDGRIALVIVGAIFVFAGLFHAVTALGLFMLKGFGRICQIIQSVVGLLGIPIGTIISAIVLYYMTRPGVVLLFSGRAPASMTIEERQLVEKDGNKGALIVVLAIVAAFGGVALIGIIAAIAIPGLMRARMSGNEAAAIGRLRAMASAQAVYASTHDGGRFATLTCLTSPSTCDDQVQTPYFRQDGPATAPRSGYVFRLHIPDDGSRYTYWAEPENFGVTGNRSFCIDQGGTVLQYRSPTEGPSEGDAPCPDGGEPVL
jgi:type II secretory pathway pseudopilin PulG